MMATNWRVGLDKDEQHKHMFENEVNCDVTFLVGPEKVKINAHKYILVLSSPVFEAMFSRQSGFVEKDGCVEVPDVEEEIFRMFLLTLYTDEELGITEENVTQLYHVSTKYDVPSIVEECETYLSENMTEENVCVMLEHAARFSSERLIEECVDFITEHAQTVLESEETFLKLSSHALKLIIDGDNFSATEDIIYRGVLRWAAAQCREKNLEETPANKRDIIGDLLYSIRFPLVEDKVFKELVVPDGILTEDEIQKLQKYTAQPDDRKDNSLLNKFSAKPRRRGVLSDSHVVKRFEYIGSEWRSEEPDAIEFMCNKPIYLKGLIVYNVSDIDDYEVTHTMEVFDCQTKKRLCFSSETFRYNSEEECEIHFYKPHVIPIKPFRRYKIVQSESFARLHYGHDGKDCTTVEGVEFTFFDAEDSEGRTSIDEGQIAGFIFC